MNKIGKLSTLISFCHSPLNFFLSSDLGRSVLVPVLFLLCLMTRTTLQLIVRRLCSSSFTFSEGGVWAGIWEFQNLFRQFMPYIGRSRNDVPSNVALAWFLKIRGRRYPSQASCSTITSFLYYTKWSRRKLERSWGHLQGYAALQDRIQAFCVLFISILPYLCSYYLWRHPLFSYRLSFHILFFQLTSRSGSRTSIFLWTTSLNHEFGTAFRLKIMNKKLFINSIIWRTS